jgi:glyoxylase-like metal-dependent hydrolase (beta-lactamase superfamily II)
MDHHRTSRPLVRHLGGGALRPPGGEAAGFGADELPCHLLLVETPSRRVLVDGGIGLHDIEDSTGRLGADFCAMADPVLDESATAVHQLAHAGIDPTSVTDIVLTHPDRDHVGAVADLPRARVHAHPLVRAIVEDPSDPRDRERVRPAQWAHRVRWAPAPTAVPRWFGFEAWALDDLGPDLVLVDLPGHARGHAGLAVRRERGWLLHAGDAYFHRHEVHGGEVPPSLLAFEEMVEADRSHRLDTQARLAALPPDVDLVCSHDPVELRARTGPPVST